MTEPATQADRECAAEAAKDDEGWANSILSGKCDSGATVKAARISRERQEAIIAAKDARIAELEAALKPFADHAIKYEPDEGDGEFPAFDSSFRIKHLRRAAQALKGEAQ